MVSSAVWAATAALHSVFSTAPALTSLCRVVDGPVPTDSPDPRVLLVGSTGDPDGGDSDISSTSEWAGIGRGRREESISVNCAIVVRAGDNSFVNRRAEASAILSIVETILRDDPTLAGAVRVAQLESIDVFAEAFSAGSRLRVVFVVQCQARI